MRRAALALVGSAVAAAVLLVGSPAPATDARAALDAFLRRIAHLEVRDLTIHQHVTIYHPDGLHPGARGEQRLLIKPPGRQRLEQVIDGEREVRLLVNGRVWVRRRGGQAYEAPPTEHEREGMGLLVPARRSVDELLEEWRGLGIRTDVSHVERLGGRTVTVIGAAAGDRDAPSAWVDPDLGVVRFVTRERLPGRTALVDRAFSDHRPLAGGFRFPWRQETFVDGKLLLLVTVHVATANSGLADAMFDPEAFRRER
ncbi:MAG: hypothetical protein HYU51_18495 [Candidatus Rokubacteria bacterium]|nr:hypothetical protein [Candidatus Rokubacteria bacterium]